MSQELHIRWLIRRDMPEVLQIEADSFGDFAWSEEDFLQVIRQRNCFGLVGEIGDEVVAFLMKQLSKSSVTILNLAVKPKYRRMGFGRLMIAHLVEKLGLRTRINVSVRESNLGAQLFFHALGFKAKGVDRRFYDDTDEDAYQMVYTLKRSEVASDA